MIKITYWCDRCMAQIPGDVGIITWGYATQEDPGEMTGVNPFAGRHYCTACMEKIWAFIAGTDGQKEQAAKAADAAAGCSGQAAADKPEAADQLPEDDEFDWPKVFALYNAGWKVRKIADEFGGKITEQQIRNKIAYVKRKEAAIQAAKETGHEN